MFRLADARAGFGVSEQGLLQAGTGEPGEVGVEVGGQGLEAADDRECLLVVDQPSQFGVDIVSEASTASAWVISRDRSAVTWASWAAIFDI